MAGPPRLTAVPPAQPAPDPAPAGDRSERRRPRAILVLAILLVLSLAGLAFEARQAAKLEHRVEELSQALAEAQASVAAHREHLGVIQERVGGLRQQLDALETLVQSSPEPSSRR